MTTELDDALADRSLRAQLREFGIDRVEHGSVLASPAPALVRGWRVAFERADRFASGLLPDTRTWIRGCLRSLACEPATDKLRADAAEVEAALRLCGVGPVIRVPVAKKTTTVDFRIGDVHVEAYCPQEHTDEREVVEKDLEQQLARASGPIRVAIAHGHPHTGSGRSLVAGQITHDPASRAREFAANKVMLRLFSRKKREARQFPDNEKNVLWLDLKHGLGVASRDCLPLRSEVAKGTCFLGTFGVWHAFYGFKGAPLFRERATLEGPVGLRTTYEQEPPGWFREQTKISAAIVSTLSGVLLFENPWAKVSIDPSTRRRFAQLSEFRPERSWFGSQDAVQRDVDSALDKIAWLASIVDEPFQDCSEPKHA